MCQLDGSDAVPPRGEDEKSAANLYAVTSRRLSHGSRKVAGNSLHYGLSFFNQY